MDSLISCAYPCCCYDSRIFKWISEKDSVADHLPSPLHDLVQNPITAFLLLIVLYIFFLVIVLPLYFISFLIPSTGSVFIFAFALWKIVVGIIRFISFPGHTSSVQRDIEKAYARNVSIRISQFCKELNGLVEALKKVSEGQDFGPHLNHLYENVTFRKHHHMRTLHGGLEGIISGDFVNLVTSEAMVQSRDLHTKLKDVFSSLDVVLSATSPYFSGKCTQSSKLRNILEPLAAQGLFESLKESSAALLSTGAKLKPPSENNDNQLLSAIKNYYSATKLFNHPANIELMRQEVLYLWQGRRVSIPISNIKLDGVYIYASGSKDGPTSQKGTLVFCNPNAGLYEAVCCAALHGADWLFLYKDLGYDIFVFNYRGYGSSGGFPHPQVLNSDGEQVIQFLEGAPFFAHRIIVHGESMGGMVASHMGSNSNVDAVIADRTFSRLDAAAERLLAPWAGRIMRYFTGWNHDSVSNYTNARCPKLICQDDNDKIIANCASLKTGVAIRLELGVTFYGVVELGYAYLVAEAADVPPPHANMTVPHPGAMMLEPQIVHLYACIRYAIKRAEACGSPSIAKKKSEEFFLQMEEGNANENWILLQPHDDDPKAAFAGEKKAWLHMWHLLYRTDGVTGTYLGRSMESYDDFRGWICSLVVWAPFLLSQHPNSSSKEYGTVKSTVSGLELLWKKSPAISSNMYFLYILNFFRYLETRVTCSPQNSLHGESNVGNLLPLNCGHNTKFIKSEKDSLVNFLKKHELLKPTEVCR